jgi:tyrosinase
MHTYTSDELEIPTLREGATFARADVVLEGVDHSGPSYEGLVFLSNPEATIETPREPGVGYAGSFTIFGHGGCFGAEGHCATDERTVDAFDVRPPPPLVPLTVTVIVTEALVRHPDPNLTVRIVAVEPGLDRPQQSEALQLTKVKVLTYDHHQEETS